MQPQAFGWCIGASAASARRRGWRSSLGRRRRFCASGPLGAIVALAVTLVLATEAVNAAIECLLDHLHPARAAEIGAAKDAAAGAVLLASIGAVACGALVMLAARV